MSTEREKYVCMYVCMFNNNFKSPLTHSPDFYFHSIAFCSRDEGIWEQSSEENI